MKLLIDVFPRFCPNCGQPLKWPDPQDWFAYASMICPHCGTQYQFAGTTEVEDAATKLGGDLGR